jgi:hypothetical protein
VPGVAVEHVGHLGPALLDERAVAEKSRYCADGSPPPLKTTTSTPGGSMASSRTKRAWMATKNAVSAASAGRLGGGGVVVQRPAEQHVDARASRPRWPG